MSLRDDLGLLTPRLRRYAQALSNVVHIPSETADALVQRTLMHALQTGPLNPRSDMTVWLYSLLTQFYRDAQNRLHGATAAGESRSLYGSTISDKPVGHGHPPGGLGAGLAALTLEEREALLLVVLEGFSYGQASHILRISRGMLIIRLAHARAALSNSIGAKVSPGPQPRRPPYLRVIK
ncbi:sigma factor-like helix-turn-helix DNA-binding protein [Methyloferula stellata]|uniref:sigma factor-like helix-turn-helix DNA-binding protein n=1 Tax=Methyloferula stellata TaxID=876270 RepID=UPI00036CDA3E|nr:sigma factor-like helix-turn-helix DNA-binding protein [Methyloferula stellata]